MSFTATLPAITASTHTGKQISTPSTNKRKVFATRLRSSFVVTYRKLFDVGMKRQVLKAKQGCSFWSRKNRHLMLKFYSMKTLYCYYLLDKIVCEETKG